MATTQQYSLRWNNYLKHITYAFDNLRSQDDFVDVTLCCDGKKIKAHKVLLSACSGYFKEIFKENPCPHPVIIFKFIKYEDLLAIIEFMYQGEVNVQQEALQSFLQTAELLAVQGLTSEEKEKPPPTMKIPKIESRLIETQLLKTVPTTIRSMADNNCNTQQAQTQTIQLQATVLQPSTVAQTTTHQGSGAGGGPSLTKKRKITFTTAAATAATTDDDDDVYTETVEFTKDDVKTSTEVQYIPAMNVEIPEYIDVSDTKQLSESQVQQTQQSSQDTTTQTTSQYTSEYEILAESDIEKFDTTGGNESTEITAVDIGNGQVFTVQEAKPEICKIEKNSQDLPNNKWTECQFCKMVITTVNLWRHIRTQHTPQPPRKCDLCQKNFKNKYSLREHIRISHEQKQQQTKGLIATTTTAATVTLKKEP